MSANKPKKKRERKKNEDGSDIGYFKPSDVQKVQILNKFKLENLYLWGKFPGDLTREMVTREQKWIEYVLNGKRDLISFRQNKKGLDFLLGNTTD